MVMCILDTYSFDIEFVIDTPAYNSRNIQCIFQIFFN